MRPEIVLKHEFVEFMPSEVKAGTIYISMRFGTSSHLCCCGCGNKVVTPLRPTDWKLIFDGKTVSLDPSIGNWSFACRSHYWIRNNRVLWAESWSKEKIHMVRAFDTARKNTYFDQDRNMTPSVAGNTPPKSPEEDKVKPSRWQRFKAMIGLK